MNSRFWCCRYILHLKNDILSLYLHSTIFLYISMQKSLLKILNLLTRNSADQFIRFCVIGLSNTILGYIIYILSMVMLSSFHYRFDYLVSNIVSFIISVYWSFYFNQKFVFQIKRIRFYDTFLSLLRCYASYIITSLILYNIIAILLVEIFFLNKYLVPIIIRKFDS